MANDSEPLSYEWMKQENRKGAEALGWIIVIAVPLWLAWKAIKLVWVLVELVIGFALEYPRNFMMALGVVIAVGGGGVLFQSIVVGCSLLLTGGGLAVGVTRIGQDQKADDKHKGFGSDRVKGWVEKVNDTGF